MGKILKAEKKVSVRMGCDEILSERVGVPASENFYIGSIVRLLAESKLGEKRVPFQENSVIVRFDAKTDEYVVTFE